jgi:hypothetical protein
MSRASSPLLQWRSRPLSRVLGACDRLCAFSLDGWSREQVCALGNDKGARRPMSRQICPGPVRAKVLGHVRANVRNKKARNMSWLAFNTRTKTLLGWRVFPARVSSIFPPNLTKPFSLTVFGPIFVAARICVCVSLERGCCTDLAVLKAVDNAP